MATQERTVYPIFYALYLEEELIAIFKPSKQEYKWAEHLSRNHQMQSVILILLKCHQHLGYFPKWSQLPSVLKEYFHQLFSISMTEEIALRTLDRAKQEVRTYLNLSPYNRGGSLIVSELVRELAFTMADPADLINASISELLRHRFSLPSYAVLERLVRSIRHSVHLQIFDQITNKLNDRDRVVLEELLIAGEKGRSPFNQLKDYPGPAKLSYIKEWMSRWKWLKDMVDTNTLLKHLAFTKVQEFATQADALELADIKKIENRSRKYTLLLCLLHVKRMQTIDELAQMLIRRIRKTHQKAKQHWQQSLQNQQSLQQEMVDILAQVVEQAQQQDQDASLGKEVQRIFQQKGGVEYLYECTSSLKSQNHHHFPFLWAVHRSYRKILLDIVDALQIKSATEDMRLIICWQLYQKYRYSRKRYITDEKFPLGFTSQRWKQAIMNTDEGVVSYDRQLLELCLFTHLCEALQTTDLYLDHSFDFADYRAYMLPLSESKKQEENYCAKVELAHSPEMFVAELKKELNNAIDHLDQHFTQYTHLHIDTHHRISLKRPKAPKPSSKVEEFKLIVESKMPKTNLLDILSSGNYWTNYSRNFFPISTNQARSPQNLLHQLYTLFAYGCNLGATETEKHTSQPVSRRIIQKLNSGHVDSHKLQGAIADVINHFNAFELVHNWGKTTTAIADGTHIELTENNLMGERHIRYGGYGGIAYHHISETYIALFSHFIACGTWEAVYILDGLLNHQSDMNPNRVHADTQGQNQPAFGLAYLLGIELMPRIRNLKELTLYRANKHAQYKNVGQVFTKTIDWELIQTHWHDLMQVAISIHQGKILPSIILNKLGVNGRKTKLYKAFRELGRVRRTLFIIQYIQDPQFQHQINKATNKIESFNYFCDWITFGGEKIMTGDPVEQEKRVKYTSLVANNIMLYNVEAITRIIQDLKNQGHEITNEKLEALSPYMTKHIRRFGEFVLNLDLVNEPLTFNL